MGQPIGVGREKTKWVDACRTFLESAFIVRWKAEMICKSGGDFLRVHPFRRERGKGWGNLTKEILELGWSRDLNV